MVLDSARPVGYSGAENATASVFGRFDVELGLEVGRVPVTIRDVAREAGVSITVVSRALNDKDELSPVTRRRVLEAVERLGYVPSSAARALVSGRTRTLGVVVTDNTGPVYAEVLRGIEQVANAAGFGLLLANSAECQDQALRRLALLRAKGVDGVLLTPVQSDTRDIELLQAAGKPFVLLLRHFEHFDCDFVITDNPAAGRLATGHLVARGYRRIGHIAGPPGVASGEGRLRGYRTALERAGLSFDPSLVERGPFTLQGGYEAAGRLLNRPDRPEAIFAATDLQAVGVMKAARDLGLRIPGDLALVGGDDIELAEFLTVPLTTFHQPAREIGVQGAQLLLRRLEQPDAPPARVVLEPRLVVRQSCGAGEVKGER